MAATAPRPDVPAYGGYTRFELELEVSCPSALRHGPPFSPFH